jgi:hypothetical protein
MELEDITVNSQKLADFVCTKVNDGTRKLQAQVSRLEKSNPKNRNGAQKSGAMNKTKKDQKTSNAKKTTAAAAPKAAAAVKGSNKDKQSSGKSKKGRKRTATNRKQQQRASKSRND